MFVMDIIFYLFWCYPMVIYVTGQNGMQNDYCNWENFSPTCKPDEVIIIQSAVFGLMEKGKCVEDDIIYLGCSANVQGFVDSKCSGLRSCAINLVDRELKANIKEICPEAYLQASYGCQKVLTIGQQQCTRSSQIQVKSGISYIASVLAQETGCGLGSKPWILEAQPGQRINLTLLDFAWKERKTWITDCQHMYGHVLEEDNEVHDICGSSKRIAPILVSQSNYVQIVLQEDTIHTSHFIIRYEAIDCPDIVPPKNAWLRKDENDITVGCHNSDDKWQLKCVGNHWIGIIGNCTQVPISVSKAVVEENYTFNGHHVFAFAVICAAVILCCITVTIGIYCVKRYKIKMKSDYMNGRGASDMYLVPKSSTTGNSRINQTLQGSQTSRTLNSNRAEFSLYPHQTLNTNQPQDSESVKYYVLEQPPGYPEHA